MVRESVEGILEAHHAIDNGLQDLADIILDMARNGGGTIPANVVNRYNKYFKSSRDLKVVLLKRNSSYAYYDARSNCFGIAQKTLNLSKARETVMHELSHFIDQTARTKPDTETATLPRLKFVDLALYFYRATEMQARLTEYSYRIKRNPKLAKYKIRDRQTNLHVDDMEIVLQMVERANFYNNSDPSWAMVVGLAYAIALNKSMRRNNTTTISAIADRLSNYIKIEKMTEEDFDMRKNSVIKFCQKRLRSFISKALKIKYDALQTNQPK